MRSALIILPLGLLCCPKAFSQPHKLPPITVTAPRQTPSSSTTTITQEAIVQSGKPFLSQLLDQTPGGYIPDQATPTFRLRGSAPRHTAVLLNGTTTLDGSSLDGSFDFNGFQNDMINHVTVKRGPQGVYYGDGAVGGVVEITTDQDTNEPGTSGTIKTEFGSFYQERYSSQFRHRTSRGFVHLLGNTLSTDGPVYRRAFNAKSFAFTAGITPSSRYKMITTFQGAKTKGKLLFGDKNHFGTDKIDLTHTSTFVGLQSTLSQSFTLAYHDTDRTYTSEDPGKDHFKGTTAQILYRSQYTPKKDTTLNWGADGRSIKGLTHPKSNKSHHHQAHLMGLYMQGSQKVFNNFTADLGARYDLHSTYTGLWNGMACLTYTHKKTTLKTSYGTGHKTPSFYQLYDPHYGNKDLKREQSFGFDTGLTHHFFNDKLIIEVNGFHTQIKNYIDFKWIPNGKSHFNQTGTLTLRGVEASFTAFASRHLEFSGSYTLTKTSGPALNPVPSHKGTVGVTWTPTTPLSLTTTLQLIGGHKTSLGPVLGYGLLDLNARYALKDWATLTFRVDNMLNTIYTPIPQQKAPGLTLFGGMELSL